MKRFGTALSGFLALGALIGVTALFVVTPASADTNNCPSGKYNTAVTSNVVGAAATVSGNTVTYKFTSFTDLSPVSGVPGLIEYCVYSDTNPDSTTTAAIGDNLDPWTEPPSFDNFSYGRPGGNPTNIGLDGRTDYEMGTATWTGGVPAHYDRIVLHINNLDACKAAYPSQSFDEQSSTCFVLPGSNTQTAADLTVTKTADATYTRTYKWTNDKSVDTNQVYSAGGGESGPAKYTVKVSHDAGTDSDWAVSGTITVNNPNDDDVTGVDVTDATPGGDCSVTNGTGATIPGLGSKDFDYTCTFASNPGSGTNTATATWPDIGSPNTSADGHQDYTFGDPTTLVDDCFTVSDALDPSSPRTFCVGDSGEVNNGFSYDYTVKFTDPSGTCTDHKNQALGTTDDTKTEVDSKEITVTDCQGSNLTVSKTADSSFTRTYKWTNDKSVDTNKVYSAGGGESGPAKYTVKVSHDAGTDSAWAVKGTITITNPNDWEDITLTKLTDALDTGACTLDTAGPYVVPKASGGVDGSLKVGYTCDPASAAATKNTATAEWNAADAHTTKGSAVGDANVAFTTPTKVVDDCFSVSDKLDPSSPRQFCVGDSGEVNNGFSYDYSATFKDPSGTCTKHENQALGTTDDTSTEVDSSKVTVTDCQGSDLTVSKTADSSFTRSYKWSITKDVDKTSVTLTGGGSATVKYTVKASHDSGTDSAWAVKGTITITNPNDWEDITLTDLGDALNVSGACTLDTAGPYLVKKSDSLKIGYTCASASATDTKNTATAKWDKDAAHTPDGSASGDAAVAFTTPTKIVDNCVNLTDTFNGGSPVKLGKACVGGSWTKDATNTLASFTESYTSPTFTFTYTRTISAPPVGTCVSYPNTAKFTTNTTYTTGSASQSVTVCNYNAALTPGYWKNHLDVAKFPQYLGKYKVDKASTATPVFTAMNCSSSSALDAIGCLGGHLLATEFNLANKSDPCIQGVVDKANTFLTNPPATSVSYGGYTATSINYTGPSATYNLNADQRNLAIALKSAMDKYNNGQGC